MHSGIIYSSERDPTQFTKSGLMVGLGEAKEEVMQVMDDMRSAGVDFLTIGQYLQPTRKHAAVDRFVHPDEFRAYEEIARAKGFAEPEDYTTHTTMRDANEVFTYKFPDVNGKILSNEDPKFKNKVVLAIVTGVWCVGYLLWVRSAEEARLGSRARASVAVDPRID